MITCGQCRFWKQQEKLGSCECPKFRQGYGHEQSEFADDEVWVENDEGWAFKTGPEFGCVHGEQKNT